MKSISLFFALLVASSAAFATACDIEPIRGEYGVREYRASGWVFITTNQTYEQAARTLERLQASGRCN